MPRGPKDDGRASSEEWEDGKEGTPGQAHCDVPVSQCPREPICIPLLREFLQLRQASDEKISISLPSEGLQLTPLGPLFSFLRYPPLSFLRRAGPQACTLQGPGFEGTDLESTSDHLSPWYPSSQPAPRSRPGCPCSLLALGSLGHRPAYLHSDCSPQLSKEPLPSVVPLWASLLEAHQQVPTQPQRHWSPPRWSPSWGSCLQLDAGLCSAGLGQHRSPGITGTWETEAA